MADSSTVYQGYLKGIDCNIIKNINTWCMQEIEPDVVFYLQIRSFDAKERIVSIRGCNDAFEEELIDNLNTLVNAFDQVFKNRDNVIIINALKNPDFIADFVYNKIIELYQKKLNNRLKS